MFAALSARRLVDFVKNHELFTPQMDEALVGILNRRIEKDERAAAKIMGLTKEVKRIRSVFGLYLHSRALLVTVGKAATQPQCQRQRYSSAFACERVIVIQCAVARVFLVGFEFSHAVLLSTSRPRCWFTCTSANPVVDFICAP